MPVRRAVIPVMTVTLLTPTVAPSLGKEPEEHSPHTHSEYSEAPYPVGRATIEVFTSASAQFMSLGTPTVVYFGGRPGTFQANNK